MPLSKRKEVAQFVHKKLLFRLRRLAVIFLIITGVLIYELSHDYIAGYMAAAGFILGFLIGLLVSHRMHNISWDSETTKAVSKMDKVGIIILVVYILFAMGRKWIFGHWLEGYALTAFTLSVSAGGMLGRLWNTRQKVREILKKEGFLHLKKINEN
ncbi:MAG: hypothetical protein ABIO55_03115 [Ginsengibacter sp.]